MVLVVEYALIGAISFNAETMMYPCGLAAK
jgi:hypothetical protein